MSDYSFFQERGIDPAIARARPYVRWELDDLAPVVEAFAGLSPGQRATITRWAKQSPGWLIYRHAPPGVKAGAIYPEIRPDQPVSTGQAYKHFHGDGSPNESVSPSRIFKPEQKEWHIALCDDNGLGHWGENSQVVHGHERKAKYIFPPGLKTKGFFTHDHSDYFRLPVKHPGRVKAAHVKDEHDVCDVKGPHKHPTTVSDPDDPGLARRIDVHRLAVDKFAKAGRVFFVIEGCLKADAVLSAGEAVFSVPSVTMWDCPELPEFARLYLRGKLVCIVPDSDWIMNPQVIAQARLCQSALVRISDQDHLGITPVVCAPPVGNYFHPPHAKGVDDYLAAGGTIDDLVVQDNWPPFFVPEIEAFLGPRRRDALRRDALTVLTLALHSGPDGRYQGTLDALARVMGVAPATVTRAVRQLQALDVLEVNGDLSTRRSRYSGRWEWDDDAPHIVLAEKYRGEHTAAPLRDFRAF